MADADHFELEITVGESSFSAKGPTPTVMEALEQFRDLITSDAPAPEKQTSTVREKAKNGDPKDKPPPQQDAGGVPLPEFLSKLNLKTNPQRATAIMAWAAANEGKATLGVSELEAYWNKTELKAPGNLYRDVDSALKKGWITKSGNSFAVTGYGKKQVGIS